MSARNIAIGVAVLAVIVIGGYVFMSKSVKKPGETVDLAVPASADGAAVPAASADVVGAQSAEPSDLGVAPADAAPSDPAAANPANEEAPEAYDAMEPEDEELIDTAAGSGDVFETSEDDFVADGEPVADDAAGSGHGEDEPVEDPGTKPNN
jgi:hypothetical protein